MQKKNVKKYFHSKRFKITRKKSKKIGSFSLIERVILSAGAMLIFSVSFLLEVLAKVFSGPEGSTNYQIDQMPEGGIKVLNSAYD